MTITQSLRSFLAPERQKVNAESAERIINISPLWKKLSIVFLKEFAFVKSKKNIFMAIFGSVRCSVRRLS